MLPADGSDPTVPLWRAAQVFRLLSCIYVVGFQIAVNPDLDRPALAWLLFVVLIGWSAACAIAYLHGFGRRPRWVIAEIFVVVLLMLSTEVIASERWSLDNQSWPTTLWASNATISALIAVTVAFDGYVEGPVLLSLAVIVAIVGRDEAVARCTAVGFGIVGVGLYLDYAPPGALMTATVLPIPIAVSTLTGSLLVVGYAIAMVRAWVGVVRKNPDMLRVLFVGAGALVVYAVTTFTVTAGVLFGGTGGGFLAGHMAATICWVAMAAALFVYALRLRSRERRAVPIAGGLGLTAAAVTKLVIFDLGTLDGIFRVVVFIVVGLILLGMGTGYARGLAQQDRSRQS